MTFQLDVEQNVQTVPKPTEMAEIPEDVKTECMSPKKLKDGSTIWVYNTKSQDDALCEQYFPGRSMAKTKEYSQALPGAVTVPKEYQAAVVLKNFKMYVEQAATSSLTNIASIVSYLREARGLEGFHPWVFSDIAQKKSSVVAENSGPAPLAASEKPDASQPTRGISTISDFNTFYMDERGLYDEFTLHLEMHRHEVPARIHQERTGCDPSGVGEVRPPIDRKCLTQPVDRSHHYSHI